MQSQIISSAKMLVATFTITGNKKTKGYIIERECTFKIGDSLSFPEFVEKCKRSKEFILSSGLFIIADVTPELLPNGNLNVLIDVKERLYLFPLPYFKIAERNFNVWLNDEKASLKRVNFGAKLKWYNFSGRKDVVDFEAYTGFNQLVSATYRQPYATGALTWGYAVGFNAGRTKQVFAFTSNNQPIIYPTIKGDIFNKTFFSAYLDFTYRKGLRENHAIYTRFSKEHISDSLYNINNNYYGVGVKNVNYFDVTYRYAFVNIDYAPYPLRGTTFTAAVFKRSFAPTLNMLQISVATFNGVPLGKKWYYLNNSAVTIRSKNNLAYINVGFMGYGGFYLRGLDRLVVDGSQGFVIKNTLVKEVLNTRFKIPIKAKFIKAHQKLPLRIMCNTFNDYGYVNNPNAGNSKLNNKMLYTYGVGVDFLAAYDFLLKVQYSANQLNQQGVFIQAGLNF